MASRGKKLWLMLQLGKVLCSTLSKEHLTCGSYPRAHTRSGRTIDADERIMSLNVMYLVNLHT